MGGGHAEGKAPKCPGGSWADLLGQAEKGPQQSGRDLWSGAGQPGSLDFASLPPVFLCIFSWACPPTTLNLARVAEIY